MSQALTTTPDATPSARDIQRYLMSSKPFAWLVIAGLPGLGAALTLLSGLPLFAALTAGCFLLAVSLVCFRAVATSTGLLRLLVAARLTIVLALAALLFCTTGSAWVGLVSAVLLWLAADRLLGRRAVYDLWKATRR